MEEESNEYREWLLDYCAHQKEEEEDLEEKEDKKYEQGMCEVVKEETALHKAFANGKIKIIKLLLSHKDIDFNITDKQGRKPIELNHNKKKAIFPNTTITIGQDNFNNCTGIRYVIKKICESAFQGCSEFTIFFNDIQNVEQYSFCV